MIKHLQLLIFSGKQGSVWVGRLETVHSCEACLNLCKGDSKCNSIIFKKAKEQCTLNYGVGKLTSLPADGLSSAKTCTSKTNQLVIAFL